MITYSEINARVIGAPENVMIHNNEVSRNTVALVENVLVDAFNIIDGDRKSREIGDETAQN